MRESEMTRGSYAHASASIRRFTGAASPDVRDGAGRNPAQVAGVGDSAGSGAAA